MDPYKVLGVTPQTSDDDVKRAYRELARKYHPDNYVNNPLADLAETRMKEINEAYDMISERTQESGGRQQRTAAELMAAHTMVSSTAVISSVLNNRGECCAVQSGAVAINQGNLGMAEALLQRAAGRDAEWFYLTGTAYYRKGWYDEAARAYTQACQMDPNNAEYQHALQNLHLSRRRWRATAHAGDKHVRLLCADAHLQLPPEHVLRRRRLLI